VEDGICFSPAALVLLGSIWVVIQGAFVTIFWLYVRSQQAQITKAEAREAEWKRLAVRGANEIIPSLASELRGTVREQMRELRELREP
jgi:hypothetical protein